MKLWSLKGKNILVVDDFPGMRSMLRSILSSYNPEFIAEATNGEEAIQQLEDHHFDIILCDYNLGEGKDGQQILEEAKAKELIPYSSIYIMTTAENTSEMVMGAIEYKPDNYLSKPFTREVLIARIKRLIESKASLKKISEAVQQRDYVLAAEYCDLMLEKKPKNHFEIAKIRGELALRMEDYDGAEKVYNAIIEEREFPWASLGLGQAYFHQKKYDEARVIFKRIIEETPNYLFAHDWLAKLYQIDGNTEESQKILNIAVEKSPKAILRQKTLAQIAFDNEDYETSENAYKKVVRIGKYSCYRSPNDYSGLANVYIKKGRTVDALKTLGNMKKEFNRGDIKQRMKSLVNEVKLYKELERDNEAKNSVSLVLNLFEKEPGALASNDAMTLAEFCYSHEMETEGDIFSRHAIRNNHDNQDTINDIKSRLANIGVDQKEISSLMEARDEVIALNNKGVELATQGELVESISLFVKAASAMPENVVINLNTAQSMVMFMNKAGATEELLKETKKYLDRASFTGKPSDKYRILTAAFRKLSNTVERHK